MQGYALDKTGNAVSYLWCWILDMLSIMCLGNLDGGSQAFGAWRYVSPVRRFGKLLVPSGTCPPLGDLAVVSPIVGLFFRRDLQGFWRCFKGKISGFLELISECIP